MEAETVFYDEFAKVRYDPDHSDEEDRSMRDEYDFSDSVPNPYAKHMRKPVTIRLGVEVIDYFKAMSDETGIPYQTLINLYLKDCMQTKRTLSFEWSSS